MAHFNLEEQEQISKIKYFWRDYGKYIIGVLVIVIIAYISSEIWTYRNETDAKNAAVMYARLTSGLSDKTGSQLYSIADDIEKKYPGTEYAVFASLLASKSAFEAKDLKKSMYYVNWVIKNSKDKSLVSVAKLRLADIYIDQNDIKQAIAITMDKVDPDFQALFYEKRGDIYLLTNDKLKAVDSYKAALEASGGNQEIAQAVQMKLDVLGGS